MALSQRYFRGNRFVYGIVWTVFFGLLTVGVPLWGVRTIIEASTVTEQRSETCDQLTAESPWLGWVRVSDAILDLHGAVTTQPRRNDSRRYLPDIYVPACRADEAHGGAPRILVRVRDLQLAEPTQLGDPRAMATRPIEGTIAIEPIPSEVEDELRRRFGIRNPRAMTVIAEGARPGTVGQGVVEILVGLLCGLIFLLAVRAWIASRRGTARTV